MTIQKIIDEVNTMYPNTFDDADKIKLISTLDRQVNREVYKNYIDGDYIEDFNGYFPDVNLETETLISDLYASDIYTFYLIARIALFNRELNDYSNYMTLFNNAFIDFKKKYLKTHEHIQPIVNWGD